MAAIGWLCFGKDGAIVLGLTGLFLAITWRA